MKTKEEALKYIQSLANTISFNKAILSNTFKKEKDLPKKIIITSFVSKNKRFFQLEYFIDTKVFHKNLDSNTNIFSVILNLMEENFKQCEIQTSNFKFNILMNKKKFFKFINIKNFTSKSDLTHNKNKNYILKEGEFYNWLYELGVTDKSGNVLKNKQKKFKQINKFLEILQSVEKYIPENANIIDVGCGKSYLTFAIYYYFNYINKKSVNIIGFDLKKDIIKSCNLLAKKLNFDKLNFFYQDIRTLDDYNQDIHMLISLHACDIATDYAIFYGVKYNCKVILSVPCCQHEVFSQISNEYIKSLLSYGILKEKFSSILTDSLRTDALKLCGYKSSIIEFIDMEHTPKNLMIKAIKKDYFIPNNKKIEEYKTLISNFNINPTIYKLLKNFFIV